MAYLHVHPPTQLYPEDGNNVFLRYVGTQLPQCKVYRNPRYYNIHLCEYLTYVMTGVISVVQEMKYTNRLSSVVQEMTYTNRLTAGVIS
jgi:hypothetical protein